MKVCTVCKEEKELTEYYKYKQSKDGLSYRCKACDTASRKKYYKDNREEALDKQRWRCVKHKYGMSKEEYLLLEKKQDGVCAVCGNKNKDTYNKNLAVDHCHETGKIRGLLCNQCNRGIGMLGDTADAIEKVLRYLRETH